MNNKKNTMQNLKDPLIFIVEDNSVYNKLVVSYLRSQKFTRVESYLSGEECIKNIGKKPDIIIQDYLLEGINGIEVLKMTKKIYPETEFIFLSGQDSVDVAINSMKYGAYDYIVKDQMALKKMVDKINKIISVQDLVRSNKRYKVGVTFFFIALAILILILVSLTLLFPDRFSIRGN
jgi:DNA-binding NtrC family response regulator